MQNESSYQTISPTVERHWESDKQALYSSNSLEGFALLNFQAILDSPNQLPQHILVLLLQSRLLASDDDLTLMPRWWDSSRLQQQSPTLLQDFRSVPALLTNAQGAN